LSVAIHFKMFDSGRRPNTFTGFFPFPLACVFVATKEFFLEKVRVWSESPPPSERRNRFLLPPSKRSECPATRAVRD